MALSITPFELNGAISRTQDISAMKSAEDARVNVDHMNFQSTIDQKVENNTSTVRTQDDTSDANNDSSGRNPYTGDGGRDRKKKDKLPSDGRVLVKKTGGFDISI